MRIILASKSQARKRALDILGLKYEVVPSDFDEKSIRDSNPHALAEKLSAAKAKTVGEKEQDAIVVAADLFVVYNNEIMEKPADLEEAFQMLKSLSGKTFETVAGIAVYNHAKRKMLSASETCDVTFRELTDEEIKDYINNFPVLNYAAAHDGDGLLRFASKVNGNYNFRSSLPMDKLIPFLREHGIKV